MTELTTRFENIKGRAEFLAKGSGDPPSGAHYAKALCEELDRMEPCPRAGRGEGNPMMFVWQDGAPTREGLAVVEWMNCGGFQAIDVRSYDGMMFAFHVHTSSDDGCTLLSKWVIRRHVMLPHPEFGVLETLFSRGPDAEKVVRENK